MVKAGVDQVYRDAMLGHSLKGMDVHYIVVDEEDLRRVMNRYTAWQDEQIRMAGGKLKETKT